MYVLVNTFLNDRVISRHRSLNAVAKANDRLQRAVKRANGQSSYMPTRVMLEIRGELAHLSITDQEELNRIKHYEL